jgi:hypothetical protein
MEVEALPCGEIERWVSGCLYMTEKEDWMTTKQIIDEKENAPWIEQIHERRGSKRCAWAMGS